MDKNLPTPGINPEDKNDNMGEDEENLELPPPNFDTDIKDYIVSVKKGKAIVENKDGKFQLHYRVGDRAKLNTASCVDPAQTNTIRGPEHVEGCLELLEFLTVKKPASGIVYDKNEITVSGGRLYRNGIEFQCTDKILGKGVSGDVVVVKDRTTGREHGLKTVMISTSASNEVRCWLDLKDSGHVPRMFLFKLVDNKVEIHMEVIKGITLTSIMEGYMKKLQAEKIKPFSLFLLERSLDAINAMHRMGWSHNDLHGGNLMLDCYMNVKVIDFGHAKKCEEKPNEGEHKAHTERLLNDVKQVLRVFTGLYIGNTFDNVRHFENNYKKEETYEYIKMAREDKEELIGLIDTAVMYGQLNNLKGLKDHVSKNLDNALLELKLQRETFLEEVAKKVFPQLLSMINISQQIKQIETNEVSVEQHVTPHVLPNAVSDLLTAIRDTSRIGNGDEELEELERYSKGNGDEELEELERYSKGNGDEELEELERYSKGMSYQSRGFSQFSANVSDEEFENLSQISGPRAPVWSQPGSDIETHKQETPARSSGRFKMDATVPVRFDNPTMPKPAIDSDSEFLDSGKTLAPCVEKKNPELVSASVDEPPPQHVGDSLMSVQSRDGVKYGWNIPEETEVSAVTDLSDGSATAKSHQGSNAY